MKFTKIYDEEFAMKHKGYRFWFEGDKPYGFGHDERLQGNILDDEIDSLYDQDCEICRGEDGQLYGVEFCYIHGERVPGVWQRVYKVMHEYSYRELYAAVKTDPNDSAAVDALGEWIDRYGGSQIPWNGESWHCDDLCIAPVLKQVDEDDFELVGYELR